MPVDIDQALPHTDSRSSARAVSVLSEEATRGWRKESIVSNAPTASKETMESVYTKMNEFLAGLADEERELVGAALMKSLPEGEDVKGYFGAYSIASGGHATGIAAVLNWYAWCYAVCPTWPNPTNYDECAIEHWCVPAIG
jgi:hypothetical protein